MNRRMTIEEVKTFFSVLDVRECVIAGLAIIAGMRPGEIFGLIRGRLEAEYADIHQRVYRGLSIARRRRTQSGGPCFETAY